MDYFYCCPFCGEVLDEINGKIDCECSSCEIEIETPLKSRYETQYYVDIAEKKFTPNVFVRGNSGRFRWREILEEEVSQNPLFDKEKYQKRLEEEEQGRETLSRLNNRTSQTNQPKCPTCSSTNIQKISTASKVFGAAMFGLFSNTARSQFECLNCHYKW